MPGHHRLAAVAADRCGPLASDEGILDVAAVMAPVAPDEATGDGLAAGVAMPTSVRRKVRLGATAPIDELFLHEWVWQDRARERVDGKPKRR